MTAELWFANLLAYWLQVGVITALAALLLRMARVSSPGGTLACLQSLLAACLLLPLIEPWRAVPAAVPVSSGTTSAASISAGTVVHPSFGMALTVILAAGIATRLIWLAMGCARLRRYCRYAQPLDTHCKEIERLESALGVNARVYVAPEVSGPVTFGFRRPAVLLPSRWLDLDSVSQNAIVCHEFLHVRRKDWVCHVAEEIVRALLWFHPAIWWLIAEIRLAREQMVDRMVVRFTGAPRPYVEALLAFAGVDPPMAAAPAFVRTRHLARRIAFLLQEVSMTKSRLIASLASVTLCLAAAGTAAIWMFPLSGCSSSHATAMAHAAPPPPVTPVVHDADEEGMTTPKVLQKTDPEYTIAAKDAKIEGAVVVRLEVHPDGRAHNMRIARSVDPGLDRKAIEAISQWVFAPATKDGEPVAVEATIEVNFRLL
jgi:TonB family protein